VVSCTIVANNAGWGPVNSYNGSGGGVYGGGLFLNNIVARNNSDRTTGQGPDVYGMCNSLGHNLIGATNDSSGFTAPGDLAGSKASPLDPKVAPVANNGGSTLTMALLLGSPAIDAGNTSLAPMTDQRGFPRPAGLAADIGAYELCYPPILRISPPQAGVITIQAYGTNGQVCRLLASPDFSSWVLLATNQIGSDGTVSFYDTGAPGGACRFYRLGLGLGLPLPATNTVTSLADSGAGSLRAAMANTAAGGYISFGVTGTITLASGELVVDKDLTIIGPGASALAINGAGASRIFNIQSNVTALIAGLTITNGRGGPGGGIYNAGTLRLDNSICTGNYTARGTNGSPGRYYGGSGGSGGDGAGMFNAGVMALNNCAVSNNGCGGGGDGAYGLTQPGSGGRGGNGGGVYSLNNLSLAGCTIVGNWTGSGGNGGSNIGGPGFGGNGGSGGGIFGSGRIVLTNCTLAGNSCGNGGGLSSGHNGGCGGGIYYDINTTQAVLVACTIVANTVGLDGGSGGGVYGGGLFVNDIVALNSAPTGGQGPDVYGTFNSLGHNLIGATNDSSGFTAPGDLAGSKASPLDPKVAPLANNGGPTLTMALLPGSPAIDAGNTSLTPGTDQRGFPRPAGLAADIGAFEYGSVMPAISISRSGTNGLNLLGSGNAGQSCRLLSSPDMSSWVPIATNQIGTNGTILFYDTCSPGSACRFYRLVMP